MRRFGVVLVALSLLVSAGGSFRQSAGVPSDNSESYKFYFDYPDGLSIQYDDDVSESDRELVELAIAISRPMYERYGFDLDADVYVTGSRESFVETFMRIRGASELVANEKFEASRGLTIVFYGQVFLNHGLYDESATDYGEGRDGAIVHAAVHELMHLLQTKMSYGYSAFLPKESRWITEHQAEMLALQARFSASCRKWPTLDSATAFDFTFPVSCSNSFVSEELFSFYAVGAFKDRDAGSIIDLYDFERFGLNPYNTLFEALATEGYDQLMATENDEELLGLGMEEWAAGLIDEYIGARTFTDYLELAIDYVSEHADALVERLNTYAESLPSER